MTSPDPQQAQQLVGFIRGVLGCGCPDEVLADLKLAARPARLDALPVDALLDVGGRLLIATCASQSWHTLEQSLARYLMAGKRLRDEKGFNRFRFVVASDDADEAAALLRRWDQLPGLDDRLHLHVVARAVLPDLIK